MDPELPKHQKPQRSDGALRYAGMGTQMAITIGLGVWGGLKLDAHFPNKYHLWTLLLSLLSVGIAMFFAIRDLNKR